jgi:hypothetical protein
MSATYTFDVFSSLDGYGSNKGDWVATGASRAPNCSGTAVLRSTPSNGWSSGPPPSSGCWSRAARSLRSLTRGSPDEEHAGSLSLNRALMAAGLVDRVQPTIFPALTGATGVRPVFQDAADFDLELIESRTFDGHTQELIYRPTLH